MKRVAQIAPLRVHLIARTEFTAPPDVPWDTDAKGGLALLEFAGRACYQSWSKPNRAPPPTLTTSSTSSTSGTSPCSSMPR